MSEARIGSGRTVLVLDVGGPGDRYAEAVRATLEGPGLTAGLVVHGDDDVFEVLVSFVEGLERSFRGWEGERVYESVEGDLHIAATHRGHVVVLLVRLAHQLTREPWSLQATVTLEPGEELRRAAQEDVAAVLRP